MPPQNSDFLDPLLSPTIQDDGDSKIRRANINYIGFTIADNPTTDSTDITNTGGGGGGGTVALADHAAFRSLPSMGDKTIVNFQSPPEQWTYFASDGAGFPDDDRTVLKLSATSLGSNGRLYPNNPSSICPTVAAARLAVSGKQSTIHVQAYRSLGDGGGQDIELDSGDTTSSDNAGTIFVAGTRRYKSRDHRRVTFRQFGAKGDGVFIDSGVTVVGDSSSFTLPSGYRAPVLGESIWIAGAGPANSRGYGVNYPTSSGDFPVAFSKLPLHTTVTSYNSGTRVVGLGTTISSSQSDTSCSYGTDDRVAMMACLNWLASTGGGGLDVTEGVYLTSQAVYYNGSGLRVSGPGTIQGVAGGWNILNDPDSPGTPLPGNQIGKNHAVWVWIEASDSSMSAPFKIRSDRKTQPQGQLGLEYNPGCIQFHGTASKITHTGIYLENAHSLAVWESATVSDPDVYIPGWNCLKFIGCHLSDIAWEAGPDGVLAQHALQLGGFFHEVTSCTFDRCHGMFGLAGRTNVAHGNIGKRCHEGWFIADQQVHQDNGCVGNKVYIPLESTTPRSVVCRSGHPEDATTLRGATYATGTTASTANWKMQSTGNTVVFDILDAATVNDSGHSGRQFALVGFNVIDCDSEVVGDSVEVHTNVTVAHAASITGFTFGNLTYTSKHKATAATVRYTGTAVASLAGQVEGFNSLTPTAPASPVILDVELTACRVQMNGATGLAIAFSDPVDANIRTIFRLNGVSWDNGSALIGGGIAASANPIYIVYDTVTVGGSNFLAPFRFPAMASAVTAGATDAMLGLDSSGNVKKIVPGAFGVNNVSGDNGEFTGNVDAGGNVTGVNAVMTGDVSGVNGTFTGVIESDAGGGGSHGFLGPWAVDGTYQELRLGVARAADSKYVLLSAGTGLLINAPGGGTNQHEFGSGGTYFLRMRKSDYSFRFDSQANAPYISVDPTTLPNEDGESLMVRGQDALGTGTNHGGYLLFSGGIGTDDAHGGHIDLASGMVIIASVTPDGLKWPAALHQTTVGAAGAASALPGAPTRYLQVVDSDGTKLVIPAWLQA